MSDNRKCAVHGCTYAAEYRQAVSLKSSYEPDDYAPVLFTVSVDLCESHASALHGHRYVEGRIYEAVSGEWIDAVDLLCQEPA